MSPSHNRVLASCMLACGTALLCCISASAGPWLPNAPAQEIHFDTGPSPAHARVERVSLDTDSFTLPAGKPGWIEVRFHVASGFHINSHTPGDETLIPTSLQVDPAANLHLLHTEFPQGIPFHLQTGSGETLNTYQDEFHVRLEIAAPARGESLLTGKLHYQACDTAACFPPRDLPVRLAIHVQ